MSCWFVECRVGSTLLALAMAALVLMASGGAQAATNCDAPIGALVHGASTSVTDSTTTPTLTGGSATATCNNGTLVYTSASCVPGCGATTVNWGAGCTASAPAILSAQSSNLTNTNPAYGGTVTSSCTNGVRSSSSAVCNANCTIPAGQTWVVGANTCTNPTAFTIAHGANGSGTDATQPTTGTGTWSCTNGSATLQGTSTCYAQCAAQAVNWSQAASNCTGTSAVLAHGANGTVSDATGPAMGNVNISCNNGTLSQSSPVCDGTNSCAATTVNWTTGGRSCDAAVTAGVHGSSQALTDATANIAPGGTGTATATCSNGSWVTSSPVCNASCGTQTVNWTLTSNNCDASSGAILTHGGTRTITDAAAPTTGTRDIGCNNGTVTQSGGSCTAAAGCTIDTGTVLYNPGPSSGGGFGPVNFSSDGTKFGISAPSEATFGADRGNIFIYNTANNALLYQNFYSDSGASDDKFGGNFDIDGNNLAVGDPERASFSNGAAHLFDITAGVGSRKYYASTSGGTLERLGKPNIRGSLGVISGSEGRAILMNVPAWTVNRVYSISGSNDGVSNDFDGTRVVLGSPVYGSGGFVRLYNTSGTLIRSFSNPPPVVADDQFGAGVVLSGNKLLVHAGGKDTAGLNAGAMYVFDVDTGVLLTTILNPNPSNAYWPGGLAFDGNTILKGEPTATVGGFTNAGRVLVFNATTGALVSTVNNPNPAANASFGSTIALKNGQVAIGASGQVGPGPKYGAVYRGTCN